MPSTQVTFFGATLRNFQSSIGWNLGQPSTLTLQLVEDPANGDSFNPPALGTPAYFTFHGFDFTGILQKYERKSDVGGYPTFEAILTDPRELLECVQVIIGGYAGAVTGIKNLVNAYGYHENIAFGNAQVNSSGMPYALIATALNAILNQPNYTAYGGPITFQTIKYGIDLSEVPVPPDYYRIGGNSIGLLELIAQVCDDGGHDFFVELDGFNIKIRTVSRINQPPLGTIAAITNANVGNGLVRSNNGLEIRNETTTSFLVGGPVSTLYQTNSIASFWGFDTLGAPILGVAGRFDFTDYRYTAQLDGSILSGATSLILKNVSQTWPQPLTSTYYALIDNEIVRFSADLGSNSFTIVRGQFGTTPASHSNNAVVAYCWDSTLTEYMSLNSTKVSDLIGSTTYISSTLEMRLALIDFNSWSAFMANYRPVYASGLNITNPINNANVNRLLLPPDVINDNTTVAQLLGRAIVQGSQYTNQQRFYEFVRNYAQSYMGKKYAVGVPIVSYEQDPETLIISTSYNVADGGYLPDGSAPLGISYFNEDVFKNQDGTFRAFVTHSGLLTFPGANLANVSPADSVIEGGSLFMACQVDPNFIYTPSPAVVISLSEGIFDNPVDTVGNLQMAANVLMMGSGQAATVMRNRSFGSAVMKVHPAPRNPGAAAIPLRSNVLTYGPWYAQGASGKVKFEQDPTLVPWEYGGYDLLDTVAFARVSQAVTDMQISEAGSLELVGAPTASLGDTLEAGGPNITNIQVNFGPNGITTSYSFHTYTPRFGVFNKGTSERLKKLGQTSQELRRALKASIREAEKSQINANRAAAGNRNFLQGAPASVNPRTPHDVFIARNVFDSSTQKVRTGISTSTYEEAVAFIGADNASDFKRSAASSISSLFRPFSTKADTNTSLLMSCFVNSDVEGDALSSINLNPWKGKNDVEVYVHSSGAGSYTGLHALGRDINPTGYAVRALGLRSPAVLVGWGYDWDGYAMPNYMEPLSDENGSFIPPGTYPAVDGEFAEGYLNRSDWWAAGPLDVLFDRRRGVWTVHDVQKGVLQTLLAPGDTGTMDIIQGSGTNIGQLQVTNWSADTSLSGNVFAVFDVNDRKWYAMGTSNTATVEITTPELILEGFSPDITFPTSYYLMEPDSKDLELLGFDPTVTIGATGGFAWEDSFTDSNSTPIESHTGENTVGGYSNFGNAQVYGNRAVSVVPNGFGQWTLEFDPGLSTFTANFNFALAPLMQDSGTRVMKLDMGNVIATISIPAGDASSSYLTLHNGATLLTYLPCVITGGTDYVCTAVVTGTTTAVTINGVTVSYAVIPGSTQMRIQMLGSNFSTSLPYVDTLTVVP